MTIISLDRNALKSLIDSDPVFALDLKNAVISEVGRRFFEKDYKRVVAAADPELFAKALAVFKEDKAIGELVQEALKNALTHVSDNYYRTLKLRPEVQKLIDDTVIARKEFLINDASAKISAAFDERVKERVEAILTTTDIDAKIEKRAEMFVNSEINRRAEEMFKKRMADLKEMMS